jgi:hypothetical protein
LYTEEGYVSRFATAPRITKINGKFIDLDSAGLAPVATSGNYYDLNNIPTVYTDVIRYNTSQNLGSSYKQIARNNIDVYSKSEVDAKIGSGIDTSKYATKEYVDNLIGSAIGGSY